MSLKKFKDCINKKELPFDFYLTEYNICIEYDGEQHFDELNILNKKIGTFEQRIKCDKIKDDFCNVNNIKLIRISYKDNINNILTNIL